MKSVTLRLLLRFLNKVAWFLNFGNYKIQSKTYEVAKIKATSSIHAEDISRK